MSVQGTKFNYKGIWLEYEEEHGWICRLGEEEYLFPALSDAQNAVDALFETSDKIADLCDGKRYLRHGVRVWRLRLELDLMDVSPEQLRILRKYGKAENGIVREILVPDTMTLHALHYAIQKLFGWQNSHLHHFSLPEHVFDLCTAGDFDWWAQLCGVYFRFPTNDMEDLYWDDDYDGSMSFHSWLKKKYCGPYKYKGYSELYEECKAAVNAFYDEFKNEDVRRSRHVPENPTLNEVFCCYCIEGNPNSLLERLALRDLLCPAHQLPVLVDSWCNQARPLTNCLEYHYDYGDNWLVRISLVEDVAATEEQIKRVKARKPVCVKCEGLNVFDDVGGIYGYCDFLENLHGVDFDEILQLQQWSKMLGWTGRMTSPERIL